MTAAHRLRQGVRALVAFSVPVDVNLARKSLSPALFALFQQMARSEQLHSLNVLRDVLAQGQSPPDLMVAALLHDVGKSRYPITLWQRALTVLLPLVAPALARRWAQGDPRLPWQRPFLVRKHHPEWGAEMVRAAGASEQATWLIRHHQGSKQAGKWADHPSFHLLKRLQAADDAN